MIIIFRDPRRDEIFKKLRDETRDETQFLVKFRYRDETREKSRLGAPRDALEELNQF